MNNEIVTSPYATGGGGHTFEHDIQSVFVCSMLCGLNFPLIPEGKITKIKLQGRYEGYKTDDCIIFCDNENGKKGKYLIQIKSNISFNKSDKDYYTCIEAAWLDLNNPKIFNQGTDKIILITNLCKTENFKDINTLLKLAKYSENEKDFFIKIKKQGLISVRKRNNLKIINEHLKNAKKSDISDEELWNFLRHWNLQMVDDSSEMFSLKIYISNLLKVSLSANETTICNIWSKIFDFISHADAYAGTITLENIPPEIIELFKNPNAPIVNDALKKLREHSQIILDQIKDKIGDVHLSREEELVKLDESIQSNAVLIINGKPGCGKSALLKNLIEKRENIHFFYFRAEEFNKPHINELYTSIGISGSLYELSQSISFLQEKWIIIESAEKLLEFSYFKAFADFLNILNRDVSIRIILTCRDYALNKIVDYYFESKDIYPEIFTCPNLTNDELHYLSLKIPVLQEFLKHKELKTLLAQLQYITFALKLDRKNKMPVTKQEYLEAVWNEIIGSEKDRKNGLFLKRKQVFEEISVKRAKEMVPGVSESSFRYLEAIPKLEEDGLIIRNKEGVAPAHDVLEDLALVKFIENKYKSSSENPENFFNEIGTEPAILRAFQIWIENNIDDLFSFISDCLDNKKLSKNLLDRILIAILNSNNSSYILNKLSSRIFSNDGFFFRRIIFLTRTTCKIPDTHVLESFHFSEIQKEIFGPSLLIPYGNGWSGIIGLISSNLNLIKKDFYSDILLVLNDWMSIIKLDMDEFPKESIDVGKICLFLLKKFIAWRKDKKSFTKLLSIIVRIYPLIKDEINIYLEEDFFAEIRKPTYETYYTKYFVELILYSLTDINFLAKYDPDLVIKIAWKEWKNTDENSVIDIESMFGFSDLTIKDLFPSNPIKGPFFSLLRFNPEIALNFIIDLCNYAAEQYAKSSTGKEEAFIVKVCMNNNSIRENICSSRLWQAYRGGSIPVSDLLQTALMALEKWFIEKLENKKDIDDYIDKILNSTNSVLLTSLIAGLAAGYWKQLGSNILPLLRTKELFRLDLHRAALNKTRHKNDWRRYYNRDVFSKMYEEEEKKADEYLWRNHSLENVVQQMIFSDSKEEICKILDSFHSELHLGNGFSDDDIWWKLALNRMDLRKCTTVEDKLKGTITFTPPKLNKEIAHYLAECESKEKLQERMSYLFYWSELILVGKKPENNKFNDLHSLLTEVKELYAISIDESRNKDILLWQATIPLSVAAFITLYGLNMEYKDLKWCFEIIRANINKNIDDISNNREYFDFLDAPKICKILPLFLKLFKNSDDIYQVKELIVNSITHPYINYKKNISEGISQYLWQIDPSFAQMCYLSTLSFAVLIFEFDEKLGNEFNIKQREEILIEYKKNICTFRKKLHSHQLTGENVPEDLFDIKKMSFELLQFALIQINPVINFHEHNKILKALISLTVDSISYESDSLYGIIPYELEYLLFHSISAISLIHEDEKELINQILESMNTSPILCSELLRSLSVDEDHYLTNQRFWCIWEQIADKTLEYILKYSSSNKAIVHSSSVDELIRNLFFEWVDWDLNLPGMEWVSNGFPKLESFIIKLKPNYLAFECMLKLYNYHNTFFSENQLDLILNLLKSDNENVLFDGINTGYYLEKVLQKYLYHDICEIQRNRSLAKKILYILDLLIENYSATAYLLKERILSLYRKPLI